MKILNSTMLLMLVVLASSNGRAECIKGTIAPGKKLSSMIEVRPMAAGDFIYDEVKEDKSPNNPKIFQADGGIFIYSLEWKSAYLIDALDPQFYDTKDVFDAQAVVNLTRSTLNALGCDKVPLPIWLNAKNAKR